jgi:hypothetical protein
MVEMPDWLKRSLRTGVQVLVALPTVAWCLQVLLQNLGAVVGYDNRILSWGAALVAGIMAVSATWNAIEERFGKDLLPK